MYTKFAKFARLYFLQFTTFHNQTPGAVGSPRIVILTVKSKMSSKKRKLNDGNDTNLRNKITQKPFVGKHAWCISYVSYT